jgi:hypothetical protein
MYRFLLVACLLLATAVSAQRPMARIVLKDGTTLVGAILRQSDDTIVLRVGNRPHVIKVRDIEDLEAVTPGSRRSGVYAPPVRGTERVPATPLTEPEPEPEGDLEEIGNAAIQQILDPNQSAMQMVERYLWVMPKATSTRISLGLGIWFAFGFILHMSSLVNGVRHASIMRAQMMALVLMIIALLQALVPFEGLEMLAFIGIDLVLWFLVAQLIYQAGPSRSLLMLVTTAVLLLITVLCLMLARYLVDAVQSRSL